MTKKVKVKIVLRKEIVVCQNCGVNGCNRDKHRQTKNTAKSRYRKFEKLILKKKPKTLDAVLSSMQGESFNVTWLSGEGKCSDKQLTKNYGQGRYHMRVYDYPNQIVIESHIDAFDPWRDIAGHIDEIIDHRTGAKKESAHNVVVIKK